MTTSFALLKALDPFTQSLGSICGSDVVNPGTVVCMNKFLNWGDLEPASTDALRHRADPTADVFLLAGL